MKPEKKICEVDADRASYSKNITFFQQRILDWFAKNGRVYPWRQESDPFKILIAEMMLQRTRADQVLPVYAQFIKQFPDIRSLACSTAEDILNFISKLGLFWRGRLLKEMATTILVKYNGNIPLERKELLDIPGIGDYIADAMIIFAFNGKRTIIDSNVVRLVTRYFGIEPRGEMRRNRQFVIFCQRIFADIEITDIKEFSWGLIDHSAAICKPIPLCHMCPLSKECSYFNKQHQ